VSEPFGLAAKIGVNNTFCELETPFEEVRNPVDTPLEGCHDMFVHGGCPNLVCDDVSPNPLDHSQASPMYSQP